MSCLSYSDICKIIESKLPEELHLISVVPDPNGPNIIATLNDGSTIPFKVDGDHVCITAPDGQEFTTAQEYLDWLYACATDLKERVAILEARKDIRCVYKETVNTSPDDGVKTIVYHCVDEEGQPNGDEFSFDVPDSTELPDVDTTFDTFYMGTTDDDPTDGIKTLNFEVRDETGAVVRTYAIDVPDSTELPDVDTTLTPFGSSQATGCRLTDDTSAASPATIDVFMSKSWRHDSTAINSFTNTCRYTVSNSLLSNALADRSHVDVSTRGTASGVMSHATGVNNATASGLRSGVISSDGVEASGIGATAISSNGQLLVSGTSATAIAVRGVNPSEIRNNWAAAVATFDPKIGLTGPSGIYNFIGGGGANTANWSYSGSTHSVRTLADNIGAALYASSDCHALEERSTVIASQGIINPKPYSTRWGNAGPTATPLSSNTTVEIDSTTGDITTIGTFTANATPFAGFVECAVVKKEIPIGTAVRFEGQYGARICEEGERPHGVTKGKAGICAGGGIDPDNAPFVIKNGVYKRVMRTDVTEIELVDEKATAPVLAKYQKDLEQFDIDMAKWIIAISKPLKKGSLPKKPTPPEFNPVMKIEKVKTVVEAYEVNPNFDERKHNSLIKANIEMRGKTWMTTDEKFVLEKGKPIYLGAGGKLVERDLGFEVIAQKDGEALVVV